MREIQGRCDPGVRTCTNYRGILFGRSVAPMPFLRAAGYAALTRFLRVMLKTGAGALCLLA